MSVKRFFLLAVCAVLPCLTVPSSGAWAAGRDASFLDPGANVGGGSAAAMGGDAVIVEPKSEMDIGESSVNVERRVVLFFTNQSGMPVDIEKVTLNGDGNLASSVISDDCTKENRIAPSSRCSVIVALTPSSPGPWTAEVLMTHKGAGHIARAKIAGKASGTAASQERKESGLFLSSKDVAPVNFGEVDVGGKAVRSALLVNDSVDSITLLSIDLIAADNGLARLEQGCLVDLDLKPGESCPITLVWKPEARGNVSTDMIVRHSGKMGFIVIPVRGTTREAKDGNGTSETRSSRSSGGQTGRGDKQAMPPTADELEKIAAGTIPVVPASALNGAYAGGTAADSGNDAQFHLIGTVGVRAVLLKPDGTTAIVAPNEDMPYGTGTFRLVSITSRTARLLVNGKKVDLVLEEVQSLTEKGIAARREKEKERASTSSTSFSSSSSSKKGSASSSAKDK